MKRFCILVFLSFSLILSAQSGISSEIETLSKNIVDKFKESTEDQYKNNIAVFDFEEQGQEAVANSIGATAASLLITELKKTGEFDIVDRDNLEKTIEEIKFSLTGLTDEDQSLEIGKIASANYFVNGEVSAVDDYYIINVRLTDVETGTILLSEKAEFGTETMNNYSVIMFTDPKDPIVAGFRSALIPGWGQFYNQKSLKGGLMLTLFAVTTLTAGTSKLLAELNYADYKEVGSWLPTINPSDDEFYAELMDTEVEALRDDAAYLYDQAALFDQIALYAVIGYGGVVLWSIIDAIIEASLIRRKIDNAQEEIGQGETPEVSFFFTPENPRLMSFNAGISIRL